MTVEETRRKIAEDPDFVNIKRFGHSLSKLLERYPDGAPTKVIAQAMLMTEQEVEEMYLKVVAKLRTALKVDVDG